MDPVINSLVQSPLVRSMSTVPSKSASFVHGVRDNVPPFSFQKVVVKPWNNPSKTTQDQSHKFRIPQFGTLNRAYLRIKTRNQDPDSPPALVEADYDTLHDKTSLVAPVEADYDGVKGKVRIPWVHPIQQQGAVRKSSPFGSGGAAAIWPENLVDPETGVEMGAFGEDRYFTNNVSISDPEAFAGKASNAWNAINILDEMRLTTNGKLVETVYGETIPSEVLKMAPGLRDYYLRGMVGYASSTVTGDFRDELDEYAPWDPTACTRDGYGRLSTSVQLADVGYHAISTLHNHAQFIVPVTLSSLKTLSKNYQTRFVEDLELEVKTKALGRGFNEFTASDGITYHDVELVLIYHNWHDNIENTIRNSNYKRGVPASVYSTNWVRAATTVKVVSDTLPLSIPITSRNLVTEILVVARSKSAGDTYWGTSAMSSRKSDYVINYLGNMSYGIEFTGSGKSIWSGRNSELMGPDSADYDLTERRLEGGDCGYGGLLRLGGGNTMPDKEANPGFYDHSATEKMKVSGYRGTQGGVDYSFGDNMCTLRFGFQSTDEFYSGGIALQTISNPTIKITPPSYNGEVDGWVGKQVEFDVYVKHANLVRIDSDTGAVSRTLDV